MPAPSFDNLDRIRGVTSGATATIMATPVLISGSDALNTSVYIIVSSNISGTFILNETLYVNDVLTANTVNQLPTSGCVGPSTSTL